MLNYSCFKKCIFLFVFFGCLLMSGKAFAATEVSGIISQDTTWDKAGNPYIVKGNVLVDTGATLSINGGVSVLFDGDYYMLIRGLLLAEGKLSEPIVFNSNNANRWGYIDIKSNNNLLKYCDIQNNNKGLIITGNYNSILNSNIQNCLYNLGQQQYTFAASVTGSYNQFDSTSIMNNKKGIVLSGNNNQLLNCSIENNDVRGAYFSGDYNAIINSNIINNNTGIDIWTSDNNKIMGSVIKQNTNNGISLVYSTSLTICECLVEESHCGISLREFSGIDISGCIIRNNDEGLDLSDDATYIQSTSNITVNNNNIYDNIINVGTPKGEQSINCSRNYWGSVDQQGISDKIHDFYDDFNLCKVIFEPYLLVPYGSDLVSTNKPSGKYDSPVTVTLSVLNGNAIYYTLDGSDPVQNGVLYEQPISLDHSVNIKAVSYKDGVYSEITTYVYTIIPVTGVSLNKSNFTLYKDTQVALVATVQPVDAVNNNINWSSSDEGIASVNQNGLVTAISPGSAIITATSESGQFTAECKIRVYNSIEIAMIEITGEDQMSIPPAGGNSIENTYSAVVKDKSGIIIPDEQVRWSIENSPQGVSIDSNGKLFITSDAANGVITIIATSNTDSNIKAQKTITLTNVVNMDECFIATAAFGSKFEPAVVLLRHFRDQFLLTNKLGTAFVRFYYQNSPPIAAYIAQSEPLKVLVRIILIPVIAAIYSIMKPGVGVGCVILLILILVTRKSRKNALRA